jgi:hypothetical protein
VSSLTYRDDVRPLHFVAYDRLAGVPNVIVDGSATTDTQLTLSHWPGSPTPTDLLDDLSAQIVFRALADPSTFEGIEAVSNNHFDQDGLASMYSLVRPEHALTHRHQIIDVASAGDFGVSLDRDSMRIAMAIAAFDDPARSPLDDDVFAHGHAHQTEALYDALLPKFPELLANPYTFRRLWEDDDAHLSDSLEAIDRAEVAVVEEPEIDLAVCTLPEAWAAKAATRFTVAMKSALHPAALPHRTIRMRLLVSQGNQHRLECRYETWVMYRSRPLSPRPDLRDLARHLDDIEGRPCWRADPPGALIPALTCDEAGSRLAHQEFVDEVRRFLVTASAAWDPSVAR